MSAPFAKKLSKLSKGSDCPAVLQNATGTVAHKQLMDQSSQIIWDPSRRGHYISFPVNSENHHFIPLKSVLQNGPQ